VSVIGRKGGKKKIGRSMGRRGDLRKRGNRKRHGRAKTGKNIGETPKI